LSKDSVLPGMNLERPIASQVASDQVSSSAVSVPAATAAGKRTKNISALALELPAAKLAPRSATSTPLPSLAELAASLPATGRKPKLKLGNAAVAGMPPTKQEPAFSVTEVPATEEEEQPQAVLDAGDTPSTQDAAKEERTPTGSDAESEETTGAAVVLEQSNTDDASSGLETDSEEVENVAPQPEGVYDIRRLVSLRKLFAGDAVTSNFSTDERQPSPAFRSSLRPGSSRQPPARADTREEQGDGLDRSMFGTNMGSRRQQPARRQERQAPARREPAPRPEVSANAWQPTKPKTKEEQLERKVLSLLNKIAPENLNTIAQRMAEIDLTSAAELSQVIKLVFRKALDEPHYCQTYADMIVILQQKYPEFPPETEGGRPQTLVRLVLNTAQEEYEALPKSIVPTEEQEEKFKGDKEGLDQEMGRQKKRLLANMRFIGNLYLRRVLAHAIVGAVVNELVLSKETPEELHVDCALTLVKTIGHTLDNDEKGKGPALVKTFLMRLRELEQRKIYSSRCNFEIKNMVDLQRNGWTEKAKHEAAKTLKEVHRNSRQPTNTLGTVLVGARPKLVLLNKTPKSPAPVQVEVEIDLKKPRNLVEYFADDGDAAALVEDWRALKMTDAQAALAVNDTIQRGVEGKAKKIPEAFKALVDGDVVPLKIIQVEWKKFSNDVDNLKVDFPNVADFLEGVKAALK